VAVWWAFFSIPLFRKVSQGDTPPGVNFSEALKKGTSALVVTFRNLREHRNAMKFLISFLLYNDGVQTVILMATVFGKAELGLGTTDLIGALLLTQFIGVPGSILYGRIAEAVGSKKSLLWGIAGYIIIIVYAWRMTAAWQFWLIAGAIGLLQGGVQAISRSFYSRLIPAEQSSEYFGFFSISSRFASILGPLMFALIGDITGSTRNSIIAISLLFIAGGIVLLTVKEENIA
jgi:UMF1 family MFS transporter